MRRYLRREARPQQSTNYAQVMKSNMRRRDTRRDTSPRLRRRSVSVRHPTGVCGLETRVATRVRIHQLMADVLCGLALRLNRRRLLGHGRLGVGLRIGRILERRRGHSDRLPIRASRRGRMYHVRQRGTRIGLRCVRREESRGVEPGRVSWHLAFLAWGRRGRHRNGREVVLWVVRGCFAGLGRGRRVLAKEASRVTHGCRHVGWHRGTGGGHSSGERNGGRRAHVDLGVDRACCTVCSRVGVLFKLPRNDKDGTHPFHLASCKDRA